jgi:Bacterial sugar transferase
MSAPDREPITPVPDLEPERGGALDERAYRRHSSWPVTRLPAATMTLLLGLAVGAPAVVYDLGEALWPALLLPALLATLTARLVFESADGAIGQRGARVHLVSALAGGAVAAVVMAAATVILGLHAALAIELLPLGLGTLTLVATGVVRDLEIRVRLSLRRVYFAGTPDSLRELRDELARSPEATLVGSSGAHPPLSAEALAQAVSESRATVMVLDRDAARTPAIVAAASSVSEHGLHVRDLLTYYESEFKKVPLTELTPAWFLFERDEHPQEAILGAARRATMMIVAALLLIATTPLLALLVLAVRLTSPGPAIFRQARVGKDGSRFTLLKLRTMTVADESAAWATDEDHRITRLGRTLRRYRLDELP